MQQSFAHQISKFKFQTIGEEKTEDELLISESDGLTVGIKNNRVSNMCCVCACVQCVYVVCVCVYVVCVCVCSVCVYIRQ